MPTGWFVKEPPPNGGFASTLKKAVFAAVGTSGGVGTISATIKKMAVAAIGDVTPAGPIATAVKPAVATLTGSVTQSGDIAVLLKPAAFQGSTGATGDINAITKTAIFSGNGNQPFTGTIAAQAKAASAAMAGEQAQSGVFSSIVKAAAMAAIGTNQQAGFIGSRMKPATFAAIDLIPVAFDAVGAGAFSSGTSITELHTLGSGTNRAILAFINSHSQNAIRPAINVAYGGYAMAELGTITYYNPAPDYETLTVFGLLVPDSVSAGIKPIVATKSPFFDSALNSVSYSNVAAFGTIVTNNAVSSAATLSVPSALGQMVAMAFSDYITTFSGFNQTSRWNIAWSSGQNVAMLIGDAPGSPSLAFNATAGNAFGAIGVPLLPGYLAQAQITPVPLTRNYSRQGIVRASTR